MEREINKKLRNMTKSQLEKVCGKMRCPKGTKKAMIGNLLRPLRKYKMIGNGRVSSLQDLSQDVIFRNFQTHMMDAKDNYAPGVIDILLEGYEKRRFHATDETLKGAVKEYLRDKRSAIRKYGDISGWNVSNVIDMKEMFEYAESFNGDLSKWNVSNVRDMGAMFRDARSFNGDLSKWNVSNVTDMGGMFVWAHSFDRNNAPWYS